MQLRPWQTTARQRLGRHLGEMAVLVNRRQQPQTWCFGRFQAVNRLQGDRLKAKSGRHARCFLRQCPVGRLAQRHPQITICFKQPGQPGRIPRCRLGLPGPHQPRQPACLSTVDGD